MHVSSMSTFYYIESPIHIIYLFIYYCCKSLSLNRFVVELQEHLQKEKYIIFFFLVDQKYIIFIFAKNRQKKDEQKVNLGTIVDGKIIVCSCQKNIKNQSNVLFLFLPAPSIFYSHNLSRILHSCVLCVEDMTWYTLFHEMLLAIL